MDTTMGARHMGACMRCGSPVWEGCTHVCSTGPHSEIRQTFHPLVADPRDARIAALEQQLAEANARLAGKWISVEERLPEVGVSVLAIAARAFGTSCHYTVYRTETDDWFWRDSHTGSQAGWFTDWQPLPAPPAAKEE